MPSRPPDAGWSFASAIDLIDSDTHYVASPTLQSRRHHHSPVASSEGGIQLGNFMKLYESLGYGTDAATPLPAVDDDNSESSHSDEASLMVLCPSIVRISNHTKLHSPQVVEGIPTLPDDEITVEADPSTAGLTKQQRRKARKRVDRERLEQGVSKQEDKDTMSQENLKSVDVLAELPVTQTEAPSKPILRAQSNVGAKIRPASPVPAPVPMLLPQSPAPRPFLKRQPKSSALPITPLAQVMAMFPENDASQHATFGSLITHQHPFLSPVKPPQAYVPVNAGLVPRTVRPTTQPRQSQPASLQPPMTPTPIPSHSVITPLASQPAFKLRSQLDRHWHLFERLLVRFVDERKWLISPRQLVNEETRVEGIHVFVDASNIMIGFKDLLRKHGLPQYEMSFDSLALLMERRRPVAKRVLVGSQREANPLPQVSRLIEMCKAIGYECNVQEQVFIAREDSEKKKFFNDVNRLGWSRAIQRRSGSGSDSETGPAATPKTPSAPKWVEQGVDELLHLKMCQSLLDTEVPSTMVLATGDGAEAEMSDGFLAHVERALRLGWKVELITWRQQMNGGYKRKTFRQKWGEQFTIIELDDFLEDLIDTP
jgi:hypothetical protein